MIRSATPPAENIAIFDGACGFCAWSLAQFVLRFRPRALVCVPYQWIAAEDLARYGTDAERCASALHVWNLRERRLYAGADAVNRLAAEARLVSGAIKIVNACAPLLAAERAAYAFIARHRSHVSALLGTRRYAVIVERTVSSADTEA